MQIPHQPIILNRIKELNTNPKIIGRHLGLSERQSYRIVKSYKKKDQAAVSYVLDQIEKKMKQGATHQHAEGLCDLIEKELEDMKIERDTYRDNLKVLRGEHMGLEKDLKETMHQSDWYRDGWVEATNNYKELYASMQKGFDVVEKELEGVQVVLTGVRMAGMTTNS